MRSTRIRLVPVEPIGTKKVQVFGRRASDNGQQVEIDYPVFPEEAVAKGREYKAYRLSRGLTMEQAALLLHMSIGTLSELETGHYVLSDTDEDSFHEYLFLTPPFDRCEKCGLDADTDPEDCPQGRDNCHRPENWSE